MSNTRILSVLNGNENVQNNWRNRFQKLMESNCQLSKQNSGQLLRQYRIPVLTSTVRGCWLAGWDRFNGHIPACRSVPLSLCFLSVSLPRFFFFPLSVSVFLSLFLFSVSWDISLQRSYKSENLNQGKLGRGRGDGLFNPNIPYVVYVRRIVSLTQFF